MDRKPSANVIVVKRKIVVAGGHHGGAWKVAYADFVTAMMAFFLLMWLLSTTDEQTRLGLADYFSPTVPIHETRGGGDGPFEGRACSARTCSPATRPARRATRRSLSRPARQDEKLLEIEKELLGGSGDAMEADPLLQHIRTRVTDEGLIIEVFDIDGSPLFDGATTTPNAIFNDLVQMIGRVLARTTNPVAVSGHTATGDVPGGSGPWTLSTDRAQLTRELLAAAGVRDARIDRVTGKADRNPVVDDPKNPRNRRVEITLLRRFNK